MHQQTEQSSILEIDQIIDITSSTITQVLSFNMSLANKYALIGTCHGFCLVDNAKKVFKRFEGNRNPFNKQQGVGVKLGSVLEQRTQVAIVPTASKHYSKTTVYIYDYQLQTILYSNDFFLPIRQIVLTDDTIVVSNNKRLIIYNYSNDTEKKTQDYYLRMYASKEPNNNIRYLKMGCQQKLLNNSIQQFDDEENSLMAANQCMCGRFVISATKPYKILYSKVYTLNNAKKIQLSIYDWAIDKDEALQSVDFQKPFSFTISPDGNFVAFTESNGKSVTVHKLGVKGKQVHCNLWVSSYIRDCLSHGFFYHDEYLWYTTIRKKNYEAIGSMHFWRIDPKNKQEKLVYSRYSRYFSLFEKTMVDYGVSNQLIGPYYYVINGAVYSVSLCGAIVQVIDLKMSGNLDKKTVDNFIIWKQDTPF